MRSGRQPNSNTSRKFHEAVPWSPTSDPLPRFLNGEKRGAHDAAVGRHVFDASNAPVCRQPQIDNAVSHLLGLSGIDRLCIKNPREVGLPELPTTEIRLSPNSGSRFS